MEEHIKEEIASRNPNYYFSSPNREGNNSGSRLQEDKKRAVLGSQSESQKHCLFNLSNLIMSWGYYDPHDTNNQ